MAMNRRKTGGDSLPREVLRTEKDTELVPVFKPMFELEYYDEARFVQVLLEFICDRCSRKWHLEAWIGESESHPITIASISDYHTTSLNPPTFHINPVDISESAWTPCIGKFILMTIWKVHASLNPTTIPEGNRSPSGS